MNVPDEARQAAEQAEAYLHARGITAGKPVHFYRANIPAGHAQNLLARLSGPVRERAADMLARIPEEKRLRSHWQITFRDPPTAQPGDRYVWTWIYVFDDGAVDLKRQLRMAGVHVFVARGRFRSDEELRTFLNPRYGPDGELIPSPFMQQVELSNYQPACIESVRHDQPVPVGELLARLSYADAWLSDPDESLFVDTAIGVFTPNRVAKPQGCDLDYLGVFEYSTERLA